MKKKKHRTRKQKALRRALVFVLCLVFVKSFHVVRLTPMQTIRATEWRMGLEPTEIVMQEGDLYLSESETVLMLSKHEPRLTPFFVPPPVITLDKTKEDQPALACYYLIHNTIENYTTVWMMGEVFLEEADMVRAYTTSELAPNVYTSVEMSAPVIIKQNGGRYFCVDQTPLPIEGKKYIPPQYIDILDKEGNVLYTCSNIAATSETIQ